MIGEEVTEGFLARVGVFASFLLLLAVPPCCGFLGFLHFFKGKANSLSQSSLSFVKGMIRLGFFSS